jgi:PAS domain S-box-containing protein
MTETADRAWLCQRIVEDNPIAILFSDREGKIRLWNAGAEVLFGYRAEEALGQSLDLIVPERQRARHWEGWDKVMATGVTKYGRDVLAVPALRKDGSRISIEFNVLLLRAPGGELLGVAAMIQDVTARWQQQKELRARLAALEAKGG